ncbi:MAG: exopolysaccharide biosynthesis protein exod [Rhizobiales bacterium 65-79]|nr:exopolysaccharide biosynthesis protein [Hyphomicrobiales bacterium]OJU03925.1 MAG: exopolysaccharide biosynthesis protein exod [Rhizobiales bacterium 65-79]
MEPDEASAAGACSAPAPRRMSVVFEELARDASEAVTILKVRDALGDRSLAALLAFFAAINLLPLPPGTTVVLGPPLVIIAVQMLLGQPRVWLPRSVLDRSIEANKFRQLTTRAMPRLLWLERLIRPRYWPFRSERTADRVIGLVALILGIAVTLPIPFGNWLPAFSIFLLSLALSERDGLCLIAGLVVGVMAFLVIALVAGTAHALYGAFFG